MDQLPPCSALPQKAMSAASQHHPHHWGTSVLMQAFPSLHCLLPPTNQQSPSSTPSASNGDGQPQTGPSRCVLGTGGGAKGGQSQPAGIGVSSIAAEEIVGVLPAGEQPSTSHCGRKSRVRTKANPRVSHSPLHPCTAQTPAAPPALNAPPPKLSQVSPTPRTLVPRCQRSPAHSLTHPNAFPTLCCESPAPFRAPPAPACPHTPPDSPTTTPGLTPQLPGAGLDAVGEPGLAALKHGGGKLRGSGGKR